MKLIAFGDSFVEGLIKDPKENSKAMRKKINFVTQLALLDNIFDSVENYGERGSGNESIAYKIHKRLHKRELSNCFFLVCWSSPFREAAYDKVNDKYSSTSKIKFNKNYYFQTKMLMYGVSKILELYKIPYVFTSSFTTYNYNNTNHINWQSPCNSLFDIIALRYCQNYDTNESNYFNVNPNQYIAKCNHPTAIGHKLIAKTLDIHLKEYIL